MLTGDAKPWEATVNALRTGTPEPRPPELPPPPAPCPVQNGEWTEEGEGKNDGQVRRARLPGTGGGGVAWSSMSRRPSALSPLLTCPSPPSAPPPAP